MLAASLGGPQSGTGTCKDDFSLDVRIRGCQLLQVSHNLEQVHVKNT
jgi:hypothetical protein